MHRMRTALLWLGASMVCAALLLGFNNQAQWATANFADAAGFSNLSCKFIHTAADNGHLDAMTLMVFAYLSPHSCVERDIHKAIRQFYLSFGAGARLAAPAGYALRRQGMVIEHDNLIDFKNIYANTLLEDVEIDFLILKTVNRKFNLNTDWQWDKIKKEMTS